MPYLIQLPKDQLLFLNHTTKTGLYSQTLSANGLSRPLIIHRNNTNEYSATLDSDQNLHIVTKPLPDQVIHLFYKGTNLTREVILDDPKNIYHFANLNVSYANARVHLFYTANQPTQNSCELIHHILCQENKIETNPIISFPSTPLGFRYMTQDDNIYILYGELDTHYSLKLLIYKDNTWSLPLQVITSSFPIDDFQFFIDSQGIIHIVYIQEKYGRYHMIYKNQQHNTLSEEILIYTTSSKIYPVIFNYYRGLWVNFIDNSGLQMILSMDNGNTFSSPVACSLQFSEMQRCQFIGFPSPYFNGSTLYAGISSSIRIGIISCIDMIGLHPDIPANMELELLLDGVFHSRSLISTSSSELDLLRNENNELKLSQNQIIAQYNEMTELTKRIQEEGKKWRTKALALESQIQNRRPNTATSKNPIDLSDNINN